MSDDALYNALANVALLEDVVAHLLTENERLKAAVRENHDWHLAYTDCDGYAGSGLEQTNRAALGLPPKDAP